MKKILNRSILGLLVISIFTVLNTNTASASETHDLNGDIEISNDTEVNSTSRQVWVERRYSTSEYNNNPNSFGYNPFPRSIWYSHAGYSGYIYVDSFYKSPTHYEVTYSGIVSQGPFAPLINEQSID